MRKKLKVKLFVPKFAKAFRLPSVPVQTPLQSLHDLAAVST